VGLQDQLAGLAHVGAEIVVEYGGDAVLAEQCGFVAV
jgi:hypothetical protein